ncbi:DUF1232 domain-containing protein [Dysgonomonas sp. 216]|uniref:YkvA family protein n=1 Tax=Dysgonomonas sp. 216 TaxID=2302934 RepID=UPI0013D26888|nr:DUF1232 domain-containing protein [Dysgonomonas sp. 216]NDW18380.1 DUF1232 domain-containing protein [Dysgonomonas sp. 216]
MKTPENKVENKKSVWAWIWVILSAVYAVIPTDLIPDIPGIGWLDDVLVFSAAVLNLLEKNYTETHSSIQKLLRLLKWGIIAIILLIIIFILLLGYAVTQLF